MKVSIIGGGGRVGSNAAFTLQLGGLVREMALVDVALDQAKGEALDLRHGTSLVAAQKIYAGGSEAIDGSDIVVITAGLRRKPDESRLELMNRNAGLFRSILSDVKSAKLPDGAIIVVVSNPVDIMTQLAVDTGIVPANRVIGLGTLLDTTRFRSLLAEYFNVAPKDVNALILGEHGDTMVPVWSSAAIGSVPISAFPGYDEEKVKAVFDFTNKSGAEVIRLKGGAGYAVGLAIRELVHAIIRDEQAVLPVSTHQTGALGIEGVCLSLPTVIGRTGVKEVVSIAVNDTELKGIKNCAATLKERLSQLA
ncbi:MAG: lactate dehydrogenase [Armatimonadota bacterium]